MLEESLNESPPEKNFTEGGIRYELVSSKVNDQNSGSNYFNNDDKNVIKLVYVSTQGPGLDKLNLKEQLENLCEYSCIKPVFKVVARIGHLQTAAKKIKYIKSDLIEVIDECGQEGCGYFPEGFFNRCALGSAHIDSVQVRIAAPRLGFMKGMLCKKRGISKIQIPESMIKVPPSAKCDSSFASSKFKAFSAFLNIVLFMN